MQDPLRLELKKINKEMYKIQTKIEKQLANTGQPSFLAQSIVQHDTQYIKLAKERERMLEKI